MRVHWGWLQADLVKGEPVLVGVLMVVVDTLELVGVLVDAQVLVRMLVVVDSLVMVMGGVLMVEAALLILVLDVLAEEV